MEKISIVNIVLYILHLYIVHIYPGYIYICTYLGKLSYFTNLS
jgi:hypothetical protein